MNDDEIQREEALFEAALQRPTPAERAAYLDQACAGKPEVRRQVEALLRAHDQPLTFLDRPPAALGQRRNPPADPPTDRPAGRIGRYQLLQKIGEGGCGAVYLAEQEQPVHRRVALKIIKLGMDTRRVVARFEAEEQALALMDHPHIAKVFDAGAAENGRPYSVMEWIRGGVPITDYCDQHKLLLPERLKLFIKVCHAVQHAHQKGVIHRDLKPSNILVTTQDDTPEPKVIDFGVAKATEAPLTEKPLVTQFQQIIGTPAYMSPEQTGFGGQDIDTRSDIYSLGVLLYELLTGHTPFATQQLLESGYEAMLRTIREVDPPKPSTHLSRLSAHELAAVAARRRVEPQKMSWLVRGELEWIVMKALEKDRTRRYQSANLLARDIELYLAQQPPDAAPPSSAYRFWKYVRRHRVGVGLSTALAVSMLAGTVASLWEAVRANQERDRAEQQAAHAQHRLWESYLAQARATRRSGRAGQRFDTLALVAKAAAIRPSVDLRSEAASAMALPDLRVGREWENRIEPAGAFSVDPSFERYAQSDPAGNISVRRVSDQSEVVRLPGRGQPIAWNLIFSPDGRYLAATDCDQEPLHLRVWEVAPARLVLDEAVAVHYAALAFQPHTPKLAAGDAGGRVFWFNLTNGRHWSWASMTTEPYRFRFRPDGKQLAISSLKGAGLWVYEAESGHLLATLAHSNEVRHIDWSPDGSLLAAPCRDRRICVWNMSGEPRLQTVLMRHDDVVTCVAFAPGGDLLASSFWDGTTALWSVTQGRRWCVFPDYSQTISFSADGRWLGPFPEMSKTKLLEVAPGLEYRTLTVDSSALISNGEFGPSGRWFVAGARDGLHLGTRPIITRQLLKRC